MQTNQIKSYFERHKIQNDQYRLDDIRIVAAIDNVMYNSKGFSTLKLETENDCWEKFVSFLSKFIC